MNWQRRDESGEREDLYVIERQSEEDKNLCTQGNRVINK